MVSEILKTPATEVTLITRPRRFGKTLGMSMLAHFFNIRQDNAKLFQGLEITKHSSLCSKWMNQYPTVYLTLKDVDGLTFSSAYEMLSAAVTDLYKEHLYLLDSKNISTYDKGIILRIAKEEATVTDIKKSLVNLIRLLEIHYEKKVILLLDEYDVPLAKASSHGYYAQMLEIIRSLLGTALKDNRSLNFAVITGCLKIAKESIFTGTNNFVPDTITDSGLNEYFGFTQKDVDQILKEAGAEIQAENIRAWYDGYHFGEFDIYCPWDVMNYLRDLKVDPKAKPAGYWKNTSDNAIIRSFIDHSGSSITKKLENLMAGETIVQRVDENLTYDYLHSSEDNLWSMLYLTGYLTKARNEQTDEVLPDGAIALMIPNEEIRDIFETTVIQWFDDSTRKWNRTLLFDAVWNGDSVNLTKEMNILLRRTISYHDYKEDFYHAFLAGIFTGAGYMVDSNKKGVVMWSYMIRLMDVLRFLKQNTRKIRKNWKVHVILRCNR